MASWAWPYLQYPKTSEMSSKKGKIEEVRIGMATGKCVFNTEKKKGNTHHMGDGIWKKARPYFFFF